MIDISKLLEPITFDNLKDLTPGEWIWDSKLISRRAHIRSLGDERITEPIGFRQIHILDLDLFPTYSSNPFMLSDIDNKIIAGPTWVFFEEGRFFKFKKKGE